MDRSGDSLFYPQNRWQTSIHEDCRSLHPGRCSDWRITLLAAPSHHVFSLSPNTWQWALAAFVPDYSGGPVLDFHEVPF